MITATVNDKIIVLDGFKSEFIRIAVDYDDVPHTEVEAWVTELIDVLNREGF